MFRVHFKYGGIKLLLNLMPEPERSRTLGAYALTSILPGPI